MDLDLVGTGEIADRCKIEHGTVRQWRTRGHLPAPEWVIGGRPVWRWETIAFVPVVYKHLFELGALPTVPQLLPTDPVAP